MALRLTIGFSDNPRLDPLKDGTVKPQNIELEFVTLEPGTLFWRNLAFDEFDASEMSISETLLARERGGGTKWDWSALPVFLSRGHHWPNLYVNTNSGIAGLGDIRGKRIGVPDYDMTAALWFRITLKDLYGIEASDNVWFNGRTKELSHAGALGLDKEGPRGVEHHWLNADQTLDQMLDRGEIDACTAIRPQSRVTAGDPTAIDRWAGPRSKAIRGSRNCSPTTARASSSSSMRRPGVFSPITTSLSRTGFCASIPGRRSNSTTRSAAQRKSPMSVRGATRRPASISRARISPSRVPLSAATPIRSASPRWAATSSARSRDRSSRGC